jgi:predicted nucleotidyltransferase
MSMKAIGRQGRRMFAYEKALLQRISDRIRREFPGRIVSVHAFGSRVRGDHNAWSDFDVLVVVRDKDPLLESGIIGVFVEEEMQAGASFTPVVKDVRAFELEKKHHTPFYEAIVREGVPV